MPLPDDTTHAPFAPTRWSVVRRAGELGADHSAKALSELCAAYWRPVYAFVRRRGHSREEAQDVTQSFFLRLLEKNVVAQADAERGKFRTFLLGAMTHFLANAHDYATAQKRGGGATVLPLEFESSGERVVIDPADTRTPETAFEQEWAETLLARVMERLAADFDRAGKTAIFRELKIYLVEDKGAVSYEQMSARLGISLSAVKSAISRLRQRYGELLREEIAQTVESAEEVEEEIRHLLAVFGS